MKKPLQFYLITDLHYFENTLGAEGEAYEARSLTDQKCIAETGAIIDSAFEQIAADTETNIVLIAGDMTFNGEAESHKSVIKKLEALKQSRKKIFLITGNHDSSHEAYAFSGAERIPVEGTKRETLMDLYDAYGLKDAIAVSREHLCYVAQLGEGVRMLGIHYNVGSGNSISEESLEWIVGQIEAAKAEGDLIFGMAHVPLLPGSPLLTLVGDAKVHNWERIAARLADAGMPLIFTGHMHMQSVNRLVTPNGNSIFDVCTGSLAGGPCAIRKVLLDENRVMRITTSTVADFDWDKKGMTADEYFIWRFNRKIEHEIFSKLGKHKFIARVVRKSSLLPFGIEFVRNIFYGDQPYTKETPEYARVMKLLRRLKLFVWIAERKLSSRSELFQDIPALAASLIGKEQKIDSNAVIDLNNGEITAQR